MQPHDLPSMPLAIDTDALHEEHRQRLEHMKPRASVTIIGKALRTSNVAITPQDIEAISHRKVDATMAITIVDAWLQSDYQVLSLCGDNDAGKTFAAAYGLAETIRTALDACDSREEPELEWQRMLRRAEERGYGIAVTPDELARVLRPDRFDDEKADALKRAPFIILDELDAEVVAHFQSSFLELIEAVRRRGTKMVITSNKPKSLLAQRYDKRIISRLDDISQVFDVPSNAMRRRGALSKGLQAIDGGRRG